jgi:hypothetical protein
MSDAERTADQLGRIAYEGYSAASDGRSLVSGVELPDWPDLPEIIRYAWTLAAAEVAAAVIAGVPDGR